MKIIGLVGGSGSGKGTVAAILSEFGFKHVDTDKLYHEITASKSPCLDALVTEFGEEILTPDYSLDRKKLSAIVFRGENAKAKRENLNKIAHRFVLEKTRELIAEYKKDGAWAVLVDAPLLFESGFDRECDLIMAVTADAELRKARIMERDNISYEAATMRINAQLPDEYIIEHSNFIIVNNGELCQLRKQLQNIVEKILN